MAENKLNIIYKQTKDLKPYANNPRLNDDAVEYVANSIKEFGFKVPMVITSDGEIVAGHTRLKACERLGVTEVPCVIADDLTPEQIKAFRLADNKVGEIATWDFPKLDIEMQEIEMDMTPFGFEELGTIDEQTTEEDDFDPSSTVEPRVQRGDVWVLGRHRLMCGDATSKDDIQTLTGGVSVDLVLTDPPYGMRLDTDFSTIHGSLRVNGATHGTKGKKYDAVIGDNEDFTPALIDTIFENTNNPSEIFLFGADYYAEYLPNKNDGSWLVWDKRKESQADAIGSEFELIWSKTKHKRRMLRHDWFGFLSSESQQEAQNRVHPTQKPVILLTDILTQWGNNKERILDPYGGSGSTLIACEQLDRICYMLEIDPHYCDVIIARWEKYTGNKAVKA